jgi:DNA helicase-2/ATP-dependent DNA helicase PcrA
VRLSSIHRAKGTQSTVVFLLGASEGIFPSSHPNTNEEEERRICFVATTRAKELLIVSSPRTIEGKATSPSRFIREGWFKRLFFPSAHRIVKQLSKL